jgi:formylglycine-generating enzyme required for sulfatase activity
MGSTPGQLDRPFLEPDRVAVEQPSLVVSLDSPFLLGLTEVTVDEYRRFVEATGRASAPCLVFDFEARRWRSSDRTWSDPGFSQTDDHPVVCVSWHDAQTYVTWLSEQGEGHYRLPRETEWEYAARAGSQALFPWGDDEHEACRHANVADRTGVAAGVASSQGGAFPCDDGYAFTAPARFGEPNAFGIHGMIGNVGEWQQDCMIRTLEGMPADGSAREFSGCKERVMRGGSWFNPMLYGRPAFRYGTDPNLAFNLVGFRVVREISHPGGLDPETSREMNP